MRFAVASAILVQTLQVSSSSSLSTSSSVVTGNNGESQRGELIGVMQGLKREASEKLVDLKAAVSAQGSLVNQAAIECRPLSEASLENAENEADVGILGCGPDQFCVPSYESSLGGICVNFEEAKVDRRRLKKKVVVLNPSYCNNPGIPCNCSNFNTQDQTGVITCQLSNNYCIGGTQFCGVSKGFYNSTTRDAIFVSECDYVQRGATDYQVCYGYSTNKNNDCIIKVDGVDCQECTVGGNPNNNGDNQDAGPNDLCFTFNCQNTKAKVQGTTCNDEFPVWSALLGIITKEPTASPEPTSTPQPTRSPSTIMPSTLAPSIMTPSTIMPSTLAPSIMTPSTIMPSTLAPSKMTTGFPSTLAPVVVSTTAETDAPTEAPVPETDAPETDAPETDAPTEAPVPETDAPETDAPETDAPDTDDTTGSDGGRGGSSPDVQGSLPSAAVSNVILATTVSMMVLAAAPILMFASVV